MSKNPQHLSLSNVHYTPPPVVEASRTTLGTIHLDPFSDSVGNTVVKAKEFYTDNGYNLPYYGNVFMNPPGGCVHFDSDKQVWVNTNRGKSSIGLSWSLLESAYLKHAVSSAIFLGFSLELIPRCPSVLKYPICFIDSTGYEYYPDWVKPSGRLCFARFEDKTRQFIPDRSPTHGSFIVYLPFRDNLDWCRNSIDVFYTEFFKFGSVGAFIL